MDNTKADKEGSEKTRKSYDEDFKMPKNIRQIGNISNLSKVIYVEDYVMSYIKQLSEKEHSDYKLAILLGKHIYDGGKNIFIKGAIEAKEVDLSREEIFTDELWADIYEKIKKYFSNVEIVGWAITGLGVLINLDEQIKALHVENFKGPDKVLFKFDTMENEENFYIVENNQLIRQSGNYIYYEKNEEMQNYMIAEKQENIKKDKEEYNDITTKK